MFLHWQARASDSSDYFKAALTAENTTREVQHSTPTEVDGLSKADVVFFTAEVRFHFTKCTVLHFVIFTSSD